MVHSDTPKTFFFGRILAKRPCLIVLLALGVTIAASVVGFQLTTFKLNTSGNFYPRNDPIAKDWDAFLVRQEDDATLPAQPERTQDGYDFSIFYEATDSDNILQEKYLKSIRAIERVITMDHDYHSFCELPATSQTCQPQLTLMNYFYPDGGPAISDVDKTVQSLANDITSKFFFDRNFSPTNRVSKYTRSTFKFGLPLKGFRNADDRKTEQYEKFVKFARRVSKNLDKLDLDDGGALEYYAAGDVLTDASITTQIVKDMLLVSASIVVVFLLVWWYTWSFFLAMMAMCQILFTFPVSYAIYKMFGYEYFTALNFMAVFIILGIGADDVFVYTEFWKQSRTVPFLQQDLPLRVSWVWKRSAGAMFVTSFTTFSAFVATAISPIPTIRVFGVFSAITVVINFAYCITWYSACVVVWHKSMEYTCLFCPGWAEKPPEGNLNIEENAARGKNDVEMSQISISDPNRLTRQSYDLREGEAKRTEEEAHQIANYRFWERLFYHRFAPIVNKLRFPIIIIFIAIVGLNMYFATQLRPPNKQPIDLPAGHPLLKILDLMENEFPLSKDDSKKPVYLVYGINGIDRKGIDINDPDRRGSTQFDSNFDISGVAQQQALFDVCNTVKLRADLVFEGQALCYMNEFRAFQRRRGQSEVVTNSAQFEAAMRDFYNAPDSLPVRDYIGFKPNSFTPRWIALKFDSTLALVPTEKQMEEAYNAWEAVIASENTRLAGTLNGYQTCETWVWMRTAELLVKVALTGLAISLALAYVVLILVTLNIIVATLASVTMVGVIAVVMGTMYLMGWKLAVNEAIAITILAGLSVDYVVHMAVSYVESTAETRFERVRISMTEIGASIVGGAATTLAATALLFFAAFPIFSKMGTFIFLTILTAFIFSVFVFNALAVTLGPKRNGGSLKCWGKKE